MDSRKLYDLIQATPACAGKTPAEITTILNTPVTDALVKADLPRRLTLRVLAKQGVISRLYDRARDTSLIGGNATLTHQIRSACFAIEAVINAGAEGIDMSDAGNTQMMAALVSANVITQANADAMVAATRSSASPAAVAGLGVVTEDEVKNAVTSF